MCLDVPMVDISISTISIIGVYFSFGGVYRDAVGSRTIGDFRAVTNSISVVLVKRLDIR